MKLFYLVIRKYHRRFKWYSSIFRKYRFKWIIDNISHKFLEDKIKVIATITNRGSEVYEGDFSLYDGDKLIAVEL